MALQADTTTTASDIDADISNVWVTVDALIDGFFAVLPKLVIAVVVFALFWLLAKGVRALVRRSSKGRENANLAQVLGRLSYFALLVVGLLVAVTIVAPSMTPARLLSLLGIGGVAIGFAFQDIFQNLLAGILILIREPFRVGDEITSGSYTGTVEAIETRATFIRTYDGKRVIVPNSQIYTEPVTVITAYDMVRSQYDVGIGYGDDIEEAKRIMLETARGIEGVLGDPAPDVLTWDLAGSSVNVRLRWWTDPTRSNVVVTHDRVLKAVKQALDDASVDMPYPTNVVLFHDQTEETDGDRTRQREGWPVGDSPPAPRPIGSQFEASGSEASDGEASGGDGSDRGEASPDGESSAPRAAPR